MNKIIEIPDLKNFQKLEKLNLSHNKITRITGKEFVKCPKLTALDISHNRIDIKHNQKSIVPLIENFK
jgi:Leucine-rich repeat (LRR) protein